LSDGQPVEHCLFAALPGYLIAHDGIVKLGTFEDCKKQDFNKQDFEIVKDNPTAMVAGNKG